MRVVSSFWVGAYVRRCHAVGAFATWFFLQKRATNRA